MVDRTVFIAEWAQRVAAGSASLFVGAGTSIAAGYPSWRGLLNKVANELGLDIDQEHDLAAVAQHYVNKNRGRGRLTQAIANEFPRKAPPEVLRVAARLPLRRIWTTNWDELIETALIDARLEPDVKEQSGDLTYERINTDVSVYKMHGSVRHLDDIVLARIIHGFWKTCEELASFAERFQSDCQMLKFVQAATTEVADLVIERGKNAFLENTSALVCCDFLEPGRLFFSERGLSGRRLGEVRKFFPHLHEPIASGPA